MKVFAPSTIEEARSTLEEQAAHGHATMFVGGRTKLSLGADPTQKDAEISTTKLSRIVEYAPGDQVITVEAGITLAALQERLARDRQRLALDAPWPERATIGGIIATNSFGPLRARSGSIRDLILGISLVRADGVLARGGGKVVKNVAGFDLPKLACGSLGTLALIVAATLRVHPLPEASEDRVVRGLTTDGVRTLTRALVKAQLEPSALLARRGADGRWSMALRFEGFGTAVTQQIARLGQLADHVADEEGCFARHQHAREAARLRLKIAALPSALGDVERALAPLSASHASESACELAWYPTLGIGFFSAETTNADDGQRTSGARAEIHAARGSLTIEEGDPALLTSVAPFESPRALVLHRAMKARFDPHGLVAPGRFVGGL